MSDPPDPSGSRWSRTVGPLVADRRAAGAAAGRASFGSVAVGTLIPSPAERELSSFTPSAERPDPSTAIPGIVIEPVDPDDHTAAPTTSGPTYDPGGPPVSGAHGTGYAACDGVAHPAPVRDVDAVDAMARGAVWITYDPARAAPTTVAALAANRVTDADHLMMSPYPGLITPISLQAWGHRLALDSPDDPRFEQSGR